MASTILQPDGPRGAQQPRLWHVPDGVTSAGPEAVELAARAGLHLDPWEQFVLGGALAERADGKWAAWEVGLNVPRQNGKGAVLEARELAGPILFGEKLLIHSAHEQATSSEHFLRLLALFEEAEFTSRMNRPIRGKGSEAILFKNGARILFKTRTGGGGRGLTGDFVGLDEAMILPEATTSALVPTMAARSLTGNPQLWYSGSAVDRMTMDHGVVFARVRERGLAGDGRLAYFEWSIDAEDPEHVTAEQYKDPEAWAQANPGLGIRISTEHVASEASALGRRAFAVERLGVGDWPPTDGSATQVISDEAWAGCFDPSRKSPGPRALAYDVNPGRTRAAIGAADENRFVKVLEHHPGTGWLVDRLEALSESLGVPVVVDEKGPGETLIGDLEEAGVPLVKVNGPEYAAACGSFYDAVDQASMGHDGAPELASAIKGAVKRSLGDRWAWSRKDSTVDITPLVAVTLALHGVDQELESVYEGRGLLVISLDD
jgi:hypothetical protein